MTGRVLARIRRYWWLWLLIAVALVVLNEVFDRTIAGDKNGHPAADVLIALVVVVIAAAVWEIRSGRSNPPEAL